MTHLLTRSSTTPRSSLPPQRRSRSTMRPRRSRLAPRSTRPVGGFVVSDTNLADLRAAVSTGPAGRPRRHRRRRPAIEPAVTWVARSRAGAARRRVRAARRGGPRPQRAAAVRSSTRSTTLDDVAGLRRAADPGGARRDAGWLRRRSTSSPPARSPEVPHRRLTRRPVPDGSALLAGCIEAALDRELPFKCTAGLHHAVRHRDETGFEHHGFLNVLLATQRSLDGGAGRRVAVLAEQDGAALAARLPASRPAARARRWFTSFGSCSVLGHVAARAGRAGSGR